jgi:ligand-binding sensor domain-containing protein
MNIVVDPSNNLYVGNYGPGGLGTTVVEFNASLLSAQTYTLSSIGPEALASDGTGNIYIADAGTAGSGDLEVIAHGNNNSTGTATQISTGVSVGANSSLAIDSYNDLWLSNAAGSATTQFICTARPCTATSTAAGSQSGSQSVVVDHSNNIWIGNSSGSEAGSVSEIAATTTANFTAATGSPFSGGGLTNPMRSVFGGGGDQWITNYASGGGSLTELSPLGVPVSPSAGFTHTFAGADSIAIDASGNVWVGNSGTVAAAPNGFLTEIIGAAGPTITPYSANLPAIAGGANTIGNKP